MKIFRRSVAAIEMLLVFPALLFMTALFARNLQPQQYEPAHSAELIVEWFAARPHLGLWILLIALPLAVLLSGAVTLWREWHGDDSLRKATLQLLGLIRAHAATSLIACSTATALGILAVVAVHLITD